MKFFDRKKEEVEDRSFKMALSQMFSTSNIYINDSIIEKIPSVAENINLISGTIAQMPIYLYDENKSLQVTRKNDDYREFLLNGESSEFETSFNWKYSVVRDLLLYGKSYSYIERKNSKIISLHRVEPKVVTKKEFIDDKGIIKDIEIHYTLNNKACVSTIFDFLIIEKGTGILNSTNLLELLMEYDNTVKTALKNVVIPSGVLKASGRLTQTAIDRLKSSWQTMYSGGINAGKTIVLEEGLEYESLDISVEKLQLPQIKSNFVEDVERLFNIHNVDTDEKFLKRVLSPIICCIENAIDKHILLEKEKKQNYFFRFNTKELLRPSISEQANAVVQLVKNGLLTINEGRAWLDEKPFFNEENDKLLLSLGNCLANKEMEIQILNLGRTIDKDGQNITEGNSNDIKLTNSNEE
ncbi:phage portal protein [Clostridium sp. UBA4548]|uniref:phage portal protein n=1 Tax=Clostridium sp. UBA4548 TaxID=1946361 RepID=UPI0025BBE709|nr:phage portal protein [Clostridium sp. UBA4548]